MSRDIIFTIGTSNRIFLNIHNNNNRKRNASIGKLRAFDLIRCRCDRKKKEHKIRMITRRSAFDAPIQNKRGGRGGGCTARPGTSCRKKRCKTSIAIADKTILAFDIRVKEPRHHDTVMSRSRRDTISARTREKTPCDSLRIFFSVRNLCYSGQIFFTVLDERLFRRTTRIRIKVSRSK